MPRFVNSGRSVGLRFAALIVIAGFAIVIAIVSHSALLAFLVTLIGLTGANLFLRKRYGFVAFPQEVVGGSTEFWGKFQLIYFTIAGIIGAYVAVTIEPFEIAIIASICGAFALAEVLAKILDDRTRSRKI